MSLELEKKKKNWRKIQERFHVNLRKIWFGIKKNLMWNTRGGH